MPLCCSYTQVLQVMPNSAKRKTLHTACNQMWWYINKLPVGQWTCTWRLWCQKLSTRTGKGCHF